ncbi:4-hydroxy-tetrahydrodipicolinate synthase [Methylobacterium crusticola]|uniref:4-hydroxy-tetrahydrodipicolinate synthase n=1 Tax=Methylobacterium crusticola TaxID=1697972 RepID=A0ABQ4R746_9HYPH|nr:dihydrodipicolinate synthase family protein [Methylobacterium crusticola]GJD52567.1 4-hydroxy-tetrahydrodipicolinate synthase [Methylobacterium crusticola]
MTRLTGLSAFPITPCDPAGEVDVAALRVLLARLLAAGVDSIGLLGSTGSYPYLSRAERRRALEAALDLAAGRVPVLVGVGALRTDEAVRLARDARDAGAAAGLLAPVSYTPLNDDEVFAHFAAVARESGLPLCIYDNPGTTHFAFGPALVGRLARLPGVVAVKSPAPGPGAVASHLAALRAAVPEGFAVGCSVDGNALDALLAGADAWYSVAAGLFPEPCAAIVRAARSGDAAIARRLDAGLRPLWDLFGTFTSLRVVYAAANHLGLCRAAPPRPVLPLPEPARQRVADTIDRLGLR